MKKMLIVPILVAVVMFLAGVSSASAYDITVPCTPQINGTTAKFIVNAMGTNYTLTCTIANHNQMWCGNSSISGPPVTDLQAYCKMAVGVCVARGCPRN